jgi:diguanylate cyclase (GGDEF)-like protein
MRPDIDSVATQPTNHQTLSYIEPGGRSASEDGCVPKLLRMHPVDSGIGLLTIESDSVVLGRDKNCEVTIDDHSASRRHARIIRKSGNYFVVDMGSTNGTWVNGESVQIQQLNTGDRIRVGRWIFKFFLEDNVEAHYHDSVYQMMTQDSLTGAWNKRYLMDVLDREILQHRRTNKVLSMLMVDFDFFKETNDAFGHIVGDEVLAEFGRRMRAAMRGGEVFARFGGDEFAVVFLNTNREEAMLAAERFRCAVFDSKFETSGGDLECSISGGVAVWDPENPIGRDEFLEAADRKLYEAKKAGRNHIAG